MPEETDDDLTNEGERDVFSESLKYSRILSRELSFFDFLPFEVEIHILFNITILK